jgi:ribose-phosphate pyrophosphokinase
MAKVLRQKGAKRILVSLSHILVNQEGLRRIEDSPIEMVISTDSVDNPCIEGATKIKIISVAPLFAEAIMRIHGRKSVSSLFDQVPRRVFESAIV